MTTTTIDCDSCPVRGRHCGDCFVPVLGRIWLGSPRASEDAPEAADEHREERGAGSVALDAEELAAVAAFVRAGLVTPAEAAGARADLSAASGSAAG